MNPRTDAPFQDVRILIAGCGSIGRRHARVLRSIGARNLAVCDPLASQREALKAEGPTAAEFASFEDGLAWEPDAVFICTPPKAHIPMSIQALDAGAHVFLEKPLADTLDGVESLQHAIERNGKEFMVGFCFRYHEGLTKAKRSLDEGAIGRLASIRCRMGEHLPTVRPDYKLLFASQYGGAFDLTHEIDLACWYSGEPVRAVKSLFGTYSDIGIQAPDLVEILVQFETCLAGIHLDFFSKPRCRVTELIGTEGMISVEFPAWEQCRLSTWRSAEGAWRTETLATERDHMFREEDTEFLKAVVHGGGVTLGLDEALKSLSIVCAAHAESVAEPLLSRR